MKNLLFLFVFIMCGKLLTAQNSIRFEVRDSLTQEVLPGAVISIDQSAKGASTGQQGIAEITRLEKGTHRYSVSYTGYEKAAGAFELADSAGLRTITVFLRPVGQEVDEVLVASTRTNSRIDDLPVKVEVLGQEEMDEEATIVPGGIGSLLGDLSVITVQKTNPVNGNDAIRMQGLDYQYTQLLRDGLPLYEGFSGSLGVLAIPPLDLKQVEIIKGSASTLYGGGAIGGLINFISKTPSDSPSVTLTLNGTSLYEGNLNSFVSMRKGKTGLTLFTGANLKKAVDVNGDLFSDVPEQQNYIFHPRVFFYPGKRTDADIGFTFSSDNRLAGEMDALHARYNYPGYFTSTEKTMRRGGEAHLSFRVNDRNSLTAKSTVSLYDRETVYAGYAFAGQQLSSYSEISHLLKTGRHTLVSGANAVTEQFSEVWGNPYLQDYSNQTFGAFVQEDWQLFEKITLEGGCRADYHSRYGWLLLPAGGLFVQPGEALSLRLHYGSGYKAPGIFVLSQPADYSLLASLGDSVKPERSNGLNMDINYHFTFAGKWSVQLNQAFYYTGIRNPAELKTALSGLRYVDQADYRVNSTGSDTYIRVVYGEWELYLGYNHTEAKQEKSDSTFFIPFNPRDKFATTLAYEVEGKWRMGLEAAYNANQVVYNNRPVPDFWFFAGMIERKFRRGSIVLNCENIAGFRQSAVEPLVSGNLVSPVFSPVWGPVEGRVINLSLKLAL